MKSAVYIATTLILAPLGSGPAHAQAPADCSSIEVTTALNAKLNEAQKYRVSGQFQKAQAVVEPLATQYPGTFRVLYVRALVQADLSNFAEAEKSMQFAIARQDACLGSGSFKPDFSVYNTLGYIQMRQGNAAGAEKSFSMALSHAKDLSSVSVARVQSNLGTLYFSQGNFSKARPALTDAAKAGNTNAALTLKQVDAAESIYNKSTQVH